MAFYYSASERAFFSSELMSVDAMPADRVSVTDSAYKQLMADQVAGKLIRTGSGNAPESVDQGLAAATRFGDVSFGKVTSTSIDLNGSGDVSGSWTVHGVLNAQGGLTVTDITATGTTTVVGLNAGNIAASGTLAVNGATTLTGKLTANGGISTKAFTATGLDLNGNGDVSGTLSVHGKTTLEDVQTNGDLTVGGLLQVTGAATFKGAVTVPEPTNSGHAARKADVDALTTLADDGVKVVVTPDYNALTDPGFYHCNSTGATNGPGFAAKLIVLTTKGSIPKHITQIAFPIANNVSLCPAIRFMDSNGNWIGWEKLSLTQSNENFDIGEYLALHSLAVRGENPSGVKWCYVALQDASKGVDETKRLGMIGHRTGTDGSLRVRLHCYPKEVGTDVGDAYIDIGYTANGDIYTYVPTPPEDNNGSNIVNTYWIRKFIADISRSNVVHATGDESIAGKKSFGSNINLKNSAPIIESIQDIDLFSTIPSVNKFNSYSIYSNDKTRIGYMQLASRTDGRREWNLMVGSPYVADRMRGITFGFASDGGFYANLSESPVTDSNDNSIATTGWVQALLKALDIEHHFHDYTTTSEKTFTATRDAICVTRVTAAGDGTASISVTVNGQVVCQTSGYHGREPQDTTYAVKAGDSVVISCVSTDVVTSISEIY